MTWHSPDPLRDVGMSLLMVLVLRGLPVACAAGTVPGLRWWIRATYPCGWLIACALAERLGASPSELFAAVLGLGYYVVLSLLARPVARLLREKRVSKGGAFSGIFVFSIAVPAVLGPTIATLGFLVVGWEFTFSFYSLVVDSAKGQGSRVEPTRSATLFFLLVDPTLVYVDRARRLTRSCTLEGLGRCITGALLIAGATLLVRPTTFQLEAEVAALPGVRALTSTVPAVSRVFVAYWAQAGLASLRIGLLLAMGYRPAESFLLPLFARDPLDFWRRWNAYLGNWLRRYVFAPVATELRRKSLRSRPLNPHIAAIATFVSCGMLHDLYRSVESLQWQYTFSLQFVLVVCLIGGWRLVDSFLAIAKRTNPFCVSVLRRGVGRVFVVAGLLTLPFVWGDA